MTTLKMGSGGGAGAGVEEGAGRGKRKSFSFSPLETLDQLKNLKALFSLSLSKKQS